MKKVISVILCMVISISVFAQSATSADESAFSDDKETYIVLTETEKDGKEIISDYDGEALYSNEAVSCELTERQADKLESQPGVLAVSEDIILTGTGKKSKNKKQIKSDAPKQWNLDAIGVNESDIKSSDVKIEVLDSGVSYTDDINIQSNINLIPGEEEVSIMFEDANGHGTGIAGLIGAKDNNDGIKGVFPNAEIYSVKALDENLKSPLSRIVEGIYWGIENDMDIINMSFGTSIDTDVLHEAVKAAADAGIILIAAAGNTEHQEVNYPAAYNEVMAVGSINAEGELAELTSTGTQLELLAPGEQVYTTGLFYGTIGVSGTSIATAQVTGTAALLKAKDKTKSASFIRGLLNASSKEVEGTGAGLIDYNYALDIYDEYAKNYIKDKDIDNEFENTEEIPDYSDDADVVVEGLWMADTKLTDIYSSGHGKIVKDAASNSGITQKNIDYMARTANLADKGDGSKTGAQYYHTIKAFHGKGNYVASLKYLWKYANLIGQGKTLAQAKSTAKDAVDKSKAKPDEKHEIKLGINSAEYMLKDQTTYYNSKNIKLTSTNKKFLVMGFIMHLIGDIYAHVTIVPMYTLNKVPGENRHYKVAKFSDDPDGEESRFGMDEFVATKYFYELRNSYKDTEAFNNRIKEIAKHAEKEVKKNEIDWGCLYRATELQALTFRKIKYFMINNSNAKYEDNPRFCPERYRAAKNVAKTYLNNYTQAFSNILISKGNVKLNEFNDYKARI